MNWSHRNHWLAAIVVAAIPFALQASRAQEASATEAGQAPAPSEAEMKALLERVIANQHRNDAEIDSYERIERQVQRNENNGPVLSDKTFRVVPTGSGTLKLLFREGGQNVSNTTYTEQLRTWKNVLQVAIRPDDPRQLTVLAKQKKRLAERTKLIDTVPIAYVISWLGRDTVDGRTLEKFALTPNPKYVKRGDSSDWLTHARATVWIDPEAAQVVKVDAQIIRDISFGGGILGKVYKGGHFMMRQIPVGSGIWEPSFYGYDFSGRKFLFSFSADEETSISDYKLFGSTQEMLAAAQQDLTHCCTFLGDP